MEEILEEVDERNYLTEELAADIIDDKREQWIEEDEERMEQIAEEIVEEKLKESIQ